MGIVRVEESSNIMRTLITENMEGEERADQREDGLIQLWVR